MDIYSISRRKARKETPSLTATGGGYGSSSSDITISGGTVSFKNSAVRKQFDDSQLGRAVITVKHLANDEIETAIKKVGADGNVTVLADHFPPVCPPQGKPKPG